MSGSKHFGFYKIQLYSMLKFFVFLHYIALDKFILGEILSLVTSSTRVFFSEDSWRSLQLRMMITLTIKSKPN